MQIQEEKKQKTLQTLAGIKNLPSIPKVVFEVTKLLNDPQVNISALSQIIGKDQGLTTRLLSVANSPLYGIKRKVSSIEFAILVLGFDDIRNIVTALAYADSLQITSSKDFDAMEFWHHSMLVGTAAKAISQDLGYSNIAPDAFVAGILHDIGLLVIYKFFRPQFQQIMSIMDSGLHELIQAEYEVLGLSHQEIGRFLLEKWQLPIQLCDAINFHHLPGRANGNMISAIIHLADYMTNKLNIGNINADKSISLDKNILDVFNFKTEEDLVNFSNDYRDLFEMSLQSIRI